MSKDNRRVEYFRNLQIYNGLKNILFQNETLGRKHLSKLYRWYLEHSEQKESAFNVEIHQAFLNNLKKKSERFVDEESQIRKTYKSTLPFEYVFLNSFRIQDYQRKILAPIGQENDGEIEGLDMIFEGKSRKGLGFEGRKQVCGGYSLDRLSQKF